MITIIQICFIIVLTATVRRGTGSGDTHVLSVNLPEPHEEYDTMFPQIVSTRLFSSSLVLFPGFL